MQRNVHHKRTQIGEVFEPLLMVIDNDNWTQVILLTAVLPVRQLFELWKKVCYRSERVCHVWFCNQNHEILGMSVKLQI